MRVVYFLFYAVFHLLSEYSFGQSLPVGMPLLDDVIRRAQLKGEVNSNTSFQIKPLSLQRLQLADSSFFTQDATFYFLIQHKQVIQKKKIDVFLLPVVFKQQYNSHHPYGWNDGSLIPAKGYQNQLSAGLYTEFGPLSIQFRPEIVFAQNSHFNTFPSSQSDSIWKSYYYILNRIDNPERYGSGTFVKLFPGQSSVRFNYKNLSLGVSTENLWWGPGTRNSLTLSNNAPGFTHVTFNTTAPIRTVMGTFEGQVISGFLKESGILPDDTSKTFEGQKLYFPKPSGDRYINGMVITWQPEWTRGLHLGISRVFYQYRSNIPSSFKGYLPVVTALFKNKSQDESSFGRDQLFSFFLRLVMPESRAELYAEYGRNDHSQNLRDFILEPEHARAYIIGARKLFSTKKGKELELFIELTQLESPSTKAIRGLEGWYTHYQVRHGYTHYGQVLGAGIGPGASSQSFGLSWLKGLNRTGLMLERVVHNNDFYYYAFASTRNFSRHWVDLSLNLNKSWISNRFIYSANLSVTRSYNYQWQYNTSLDKNVNATNIQAGLSIAYKLQ